MRPDVCLVTVECARWDYRSYLGLSNLASTRGVATGHYTRPSIAGLLTGQYESVVAAEARGPTLATALSRAGYDTVGISYSPQTTDGFGFGAGFDTSHLLTPDEGKLARGSPLRERLAESGAVRWIKRHLQDKHATFEHVPSDTVAIQHAKQALDERRDAPLFLWTHIMGSHRPYGWDDQLPRDVSIAAASGDVSVRETVEDYYTTALKRAGFHVRRLLAATDDDAVCVVAGDHGEELGEDGIFFHGGFRRRVVDSLVNVPVFACGVDAPDGASLVDLPAFITDAVDVPAPDAWDARTDRGHALTIAPWHDRATVRYQDDSVNLTFAGATRPAVERAVADANTHEQLRALGYADVG